MEKGKRDIQDTTIKQWQPKTLGEYRKLAFHIADAEAASFGRNDAELCYKYTTTALHAAVWIIRASRGSCQLTRHGAVIHVDGEPVCYSVEQAFILFCCQLNEYVERALVVSKLDSEYSSFYDVWPIDSKATAFMETGWSAIEATMNFLRVFQDICVSTLPYPLYSVERGGLLEHVGGDEDPMADVLVDAMRRSLNSPIDSLMIEPKPDKDIVEWKNRIIDEINALLPIQDWPDWKIKTKASSLLNQISYEFGQTIKKRGKAVEKPLETVQDNASLKNAVSGLTKAERLAYQSYEYAVSKKEDLATATDNKVYDWLHDNGTPDGYELPTCETWKRQVRAGRKCHGTQKNASRAGRRGRSTIKRNQINSLSEISSQYDKEAD